jgi:hypothetical protein
MKQKVRAVITVEFEDKFLQPEVNEALVDALKSLSPMLTFIPALKGRSKRGTTVSFKVKEIEQVD